MKNRVISQKGVASVEIQPFIHLNMKLKVEKDVMKMEMLANSPIEPLVFDNDNIEYESAVVKNYDNLDQIRKAYTMIDRKIIR
ncbi:MAG: hypothetical protein GY866_23750 [Proteobacteria bacterium]|nr:hypothetical protein [Pseudomonadota bacterium]